jgi:membrane protease YdiL (CAAX protease family)
MLGIVVQLIVSWLLLYFFEKENLSVLGFAPTKQRLIDFAIGTALPVVYFSIVFLAISYFADNPYKLNPDYTSGKFFSSLLYILKSVVFENLIFTGALLYILIKRIGATRATIVSGVAFGIYHWFSWNLFGQPFPMAVVFLSTGVVGYLWALAFYNTGSVYLPFALHLGVNFVTMILFSKDKSLGMQLLINSFEKDPSVPGGVISLILALLYFLGFPLLSYFYIRTRKRRITRHDK